MISLKSIYKVFLWIIVISILSGKANASQFPYPPAICAKKNNYLQCLEIIENTQIKNFSSLAKRVDDKLILQLQNGKKLILQSSNKIAEKGDKYTFLGYLPKQHFYFLSILFYEGEGFILISSIDGKEYNIPGEIIVSPDQKKFISTSLDVLSGAQFWDNSIKVFSFKNNSIIEEWGETPSQWGPINPQWIDNNTISFVKYNQVNSCLFPRPILRFVNGNWLEVL